jgi:hypothetical protein
VIGATSRMAVFGALAAALAAAPRPAPAAGKEPAAAGKARRVALQPLFDVHQRFKPKKTVLLRFRVQDARSGASLPLEDVSFLVKGPNQPEAVATAHKRGSVFVLPFTPSGPGRYAVLAAVRGAPVGSIAPIHLGVVGVSDGLIELGPEADAEVKHRARGNPRSAGSSR